MRDQINKIKVCKLFFFLLVISSVTLLNAQYSKLINKHWVIDNGKLIDLEGDSPTVSGNNNNVVLGRWGVSSVSADDGTFLFYTDGDAIYDRTFNAMPNGAGFRGENKNQNAIVPRPGYKEYYVIFPPIDLVNIYTYSIVDMKLNNELGDVKPGFKEVPFLDENGEPLYGYMGTDEGVTVVRGEGLQSYWVLMPVGKDLYAYFLDSSGITNTPVVSKDVLIDGRRKDFINASPQFYDKEFSHLLSLGSGFDYTNETGLYIRSFDNVTGKIINCSSCLSKTLLQSGTVKTSIWATDTEFSLDGTLLYTNQDDNLIVFDLFSQNTPSRIIKSNITTSNDGMVSYSRAINGKLYTSSSYGNPVGTLRPVYNYLGEIENQNSYLNSSYNENAVFLNYDYHGQLPPEIPKLSYWGGCDEDRFFVFPQEKSPRAYRTEGVISCSKNYEVLDGQDIELISQKQIIMGPNTHIKRGADFYAYISRGCLLESKMENSDSGFLKVDSKNNLNKVPTDNVSMYPNPAKTKINISSVSGIESIKVFSIDGKQLFEKHNVNKKSELLNISDYENGLYIFTVVTTDGEIITKQIIKE